VRDGIGLNSDSGFSTSGVSDISEFIGVNLTGASTRLQTASTKTRNRENTSRSQKLTSCFRFFVLSFK
jgi:hypothetical protein